MNKKLAFILAISTAGAWPLAFFTSDPKAVLEAAGRLPNPADAHVVILDDQTTIRADEAGRFFRKERILFRLVDQAGINALPQLGHEWLSWRQDKVQIRARVIAPDGRAQMLDPATFTEAGIPTQVQGLFTDAKTLTVPLPALAPGAVIESEFELNDREFVNPAGSLGRWYHSIGFPMLHLSVTIEAPARSTLRVAARGFSSIDRKESRTADLQRVVLEASDLPAPESLVLAPPDVIAAPEILYSTVPSWQQVAQWYAEIVDRQIGEGSSQADAAGDPLARLNEIEAILAGIQKAVRYTGVELNLAAYVPRTPQETLARAYGDCKDKSALLVSRLRKAGIAAQLALLTPEATDIVADVPGLEAFTHAIVYVPGPHPLWIDPTSEVTPARRLPWADQGRLALVVDPRTTQLVHTPEARPGEDRTVETFTVHLVDEGKPALTDFRQDWGGSEDYLRELAREISQLSGDQKTSYYDEFAKSLGVETISSIDVGVGQNPAEPARVVAKGEGYRNAGGTEQSVYALVRQDFVPPIQILPMIAEAARQQSSTVTKKRTTEYYVADNFSMEDRWNIVPPVGFKLKHLPDLEDVPIGPLTLRRKASMEPDGSALVVYRVETSRRRYTVTEATLMTEALAKLDARPPLRLEFMPEGVMLMADGKWREGMERLRKDAASEPPRASALLRYSSALLDAGLRDKAAEVCRRAIQADPKSARGYSRLSWIYRHDPAGRLDRPGMNVDEADKAIRTAAELDPKDERLITARAVILESQGRWQEALGLLEGIAKDLPEINQPDLLAEALFRARRFSDVKTYYDRDDARRARLDLRLAAVAMTDGSAAAVRLAETVESNSGARQAILQRAGHELMTAGEYAKAADLLEAGGASSTSDLQLVRRARKREDLQFSKDPVIAVVQRYIFALFDPDDPQPYTELLVPEWRLMELNGERSSLVSVLNSYTRVTGASIPTREVGEIVVGSVQFSKDGSDAAGYRVRFADPAANGAMKTVAWVVRRGEAYQILGLRGDQSPCAGEALALAKRGDVKGAQQWLDWQREEIAAPTSTDPLAGEAFLRLWPPASDPPKMDQILAAAASLIPRGYYYRDGMNALNEARGRAQDESFKKAIDYAIAQGLNLHWQFEEAVPVWQRLYRLYPSSPSAFDGLGSALIGSLRADEALKLAISVKPANEAWFTAAMRLRARAYQLQHKYADAVKTYRDLYDTNKGAADDWNNLAWFSTFAPGVLEPDLKAAEMAVSLTQDRNLAYIHTLGAVKAELGRLKEARESLVRYLGNGESINDSGWYLAGRIAEGLDETDVAAEIYRKISQPPIDLGGEAYDLAQIRLAAMHVK